MVCCPSTLRLAALVLLLGSTLTACAQARPEPTTRPWQPTETERQTPTALPPQVAPQPAGAPGRAAPRPAAPAPAAAPYATALSAGRSVEGREIPLQVRGTGDDVVLVMATIHGNEPAGTPLAVELLAYLDAHPELLRGRQVLVMPDANPDGHIVGTRANANGVDVNRNFEAPGRQNSARNGERGLSEPEARAIERVVRLYGPARILSIHQPLRCVDWDGPAEALARRVAEASGLPLKKLGTRPGSFGAWAQTNGVALITLELPPGEQGLGRNALWARYGKAVLAVVVGGP